MPKRSAPEDDEHPRLKRARTCTSEDRTTSPAQSRRGRKSLPIGASLDSSKSSSALSHAGIRRRMNPESLAGRLGPALVKELEGLLRGGLTEMPSFAVRQEIQQRYAIDRRHIYDWFHNKGLRVASSEKREERRARRALAGECVPTTRTMERNRAKGAADAAAMPSPAPASDSESSGSGSSASSVSGFGFSLGFEEDGSLGPAAVSPSLDYADAFFASALDMPLEPTLNANSACALDPLDSDSTLNVHSASAFAPLEPALAANSAFCLPDPADPKAYTDRTSHWIAEQQKIPYSPRPALLSPLPDLALDELPQHEREAYYRTLAAALPPAHGIEECVGSYKAHMSRQAQHYERFLQPPTPTPFVRSAGPSPSEDYTRWLAHGARLPSTPGTTPELAVGYAWEPPRRREPSAACCMDLAELLESPVLRARQPSVQQVQTRYVPAQGVENVYVPQGVGYGARRWEVSGAYGF